MLLYFAFTLFVSATLLFFVQPLVGKMILPRLGGTPAVWNTCMVFFQGVLLVGYAYTHTLSTWQSQRRQLVAQLALLLLPFVVLPFSLGNWAPPTETNPVLHVLWLLLGMVGLPFFVVSTTAPLLQRWFGLTGHPAAKDPYFLYGASNLGSMLGLLAYPIAIEPAFDVPTQAWLWTGGYVLFALLVAGCVALVWKRPPEVNLAQTAAATPPPPPPVEKTQTAISSKRIAGRRPAVTGATVAAAPAPQVSTGDRPVTWFRRLRWILLAAVPSSLMLGLTTYLTTDIAAIPFFWVIPLALYLLTFILVFARWPVVWTDAPHTVVLYAQPCFLLFLVLIQVAELALPATWMEFTFHIAGFFATTLMCHGELAKDRPAARHLTEFYLCMSIGGVVGGTFNALAAPVFFTFGVLEYSLAMILSCFCRPWMVTELTLIPGDGTPDGKNALAWALDLVMPALIGLLTWFLISSTLDTFFNHDIQRSYKLAVPVILVLTLAMRPVRFGLGLAAVLLVAWTYDMSRDRTVFRDRGFFGFVKVRKEYDDTTEGWYHVLIHGGIDHGRQHLDPARQRLPISYFHPTGGIGQVFQRFSWPDERLPASLFGQAFTPGPLPMGLLCDLHSEPPFAVVGLGTGTLAAHARPWQTMHIYEIDPLVRSLSLSHKGRRPIFTYAQDARDRGADLDIIMGDGRLRLREAPERFYHIIVLDAFSSDAIPVHLLTADAVAEYLDKLADGGVLIFNTTNRYVDIRGVLANIAGQHKLRPLTYGDYSDDIPDKFGSDWVVLQRRDLPANGRYSGLWPLEKLLDLEKWRAPDRDPRPVWTDGYSNLLSVIHWR
ncbi:MAG: hypothetical protein L0Y71_17990 [Gemmataceae bacterium]|nr:hypothetical protein [Gemmataceae bacterium]